MAGRIARAKRMAFYRAGYVLGYVRCFGILRAFSTWRRLHGAGRTGDGLVEIPWPAGAAPVVLRQATSDVGVFEFVSVWGGYELELDFQPRVIFDLGGNIGLSAAKFAVRHPDAKIVVVEPDLENFQLLERNTRSRGNIKIFRAAMGETDGFADCVNPGATGDSFRFLGTDEPGDVPMLSMESLIELAGVGCPDFIKIDIEGAEKFVLNEAATRAAWFASLKALAVELHPPFDRERLDALFPAVTWSHRKIGETEFLKRRGSQSRGA